MRLTGEQLKVLYKAWDKGDLKVRRHDRKALRVTGGLLKLGFIRLTGSTISLEEPLGGVDTYSLTPRGVDRLLDPEVLMVQDAMDR